VGAGFKKDGALQFVGSLGEGEDFLVRCHVMSLDEDSMDLWHMEVIDVMLLLWNEKETLKLRGS
jgi:hypothetical protein